jgi:PKD repeat protein
MKKLIGFYIFLMLVLVSNSLAIEISPSTDARYVGDLITFTPTNPAWGYYYKEAIWDFGDGKTKMSYQATNPVTHRYSKAGTYVVTISSLTASPFTESAQITILPKANDRYITVTPSTPIVGKVATFTAFYFYTPNKIVWDMGDGTILNKGNPAKLKSSSKGFGAMDPTDIRISGGSVVTHTYLLPGNYTVKAYDMNGNDSNPIILNITVNLPNRNISVSPSAPRVGQTVTCKANKFLSSLIDWNFGDGTIKHTNVKTVTHVYTSPGTFTITAVERDTTYPPVSTTVNVSIPPRSIGYSPSNPVVGGQVVFTAYDFLKFPIEWNFGDGTTRTSNGNTITHTYSRNGTFTVTARESNTSYPRVSLRITVDLPERTITMSRRKPLAGLAVEFVAVGFIEANIDWNFGDGVTIIAGGINVSHTYDNAGTYTVTAKETNSNYPPATINFTVVMPNRRITFYPNWQPRVDQNVIVKAKGFLTKLIDWDLGDGTKIIGGGLTIQHRWMNEGTYTVTAKDSTINHTPIVTTRQIFPENRYIRVFQAEVRPNDEVTVQAFNFRGDRILWVWGDGTQESGFDTETHTYRHPGVYTITAFDENGGSQVPFTAQVNVIGITDKVNLQVAEIRFDNGKYYQVVPKNSKNIRAVLRMKWEGTGVISGYWLWNNTPLEFFSVVTSQGILNEIYTKNIPGIPTIEPGLHTIGLRLTRPANLNVVLPVIKYFVLSAENSVNTLSPKDGFVAKDNEIPEFSWEAPKGGSKYQIVFSNAIYPLLNYSRDLNWINTEKPLTFKPDTDTWNKIKRNHWTYWKVRALDTFGNVVAESDINDIKVVIATAEVSINKVTDLDGREVVFNNDKIVSDNDNILAYGTIKYKGNSKYLVLRIYVDNELTDQLLFRNVKKEEIMHFETSVPNRRENTAVMFKVLKTSSPAVVVGIKGITLKRQFKKQ